MLLIDHSAENSKDPRVGTHEPERPGSQRGLRVPLLEPVHDASGRVRQAAALQRLHDHDRDLPPVQFIVQVLGVDIAHSVGVLPVEVVHLDLNEVPVVLVVQLQKLVELLLIAVEGKSELADLPFLPVRLKQVHHPVVHEPVVESLKASAAEGVEQVVVQIVRLKVPERIVVQFQGRGPGMVAEVGQFSGEVVRAPRMPAQGVAHSLLGKSPEIDRGGVVVVHAVSQGVVNQFVRVLLIHDVLTVPVLLHRETHAAVAEQGDLVAVAGVLTHLHRAVLQDILIARSAFKDGLGCLLRSARSGKSHGSHGRCPCTGPFEKFSSVDVLFHVR